jgi:O-antigen ligase
MLSVAAALAALVIGAAVGRSPVIVVGAMVGLALIALLLSDITVGVVAFVLIQPLALLVGAGESLISKGAGVILLVTWLVSLRYPSSRKRYLGFLANNPVLAVLITAFMGFCVASMLWSINQSFSIEAIQRYALGFLLLVIVFTATRDRRSAILIAGAFSLSATASTLIGLATNNRIEGRLVGTFADANEYAAFCVPALLIAAAFASTASTPLRRMIFALSALVCALGIVLSGSRGGIIAIGAALVVWIIFGGRWRMRVLTAGVAVALILVGYVNIAASPATKARFATLTQGEQYGASAGTGRADIWQVGLRAYRDHPTKGAGIGTYTEATPRYLARPGLVRRGDFFTETPKVAHNMYLHILVEIGTVGLALFLGIILTCLAAAARAARLFRRAGDVTLELISRTLLAGTVGLLVADFFISGQYQRVLWILLGLCVGLLGVARTMVPARRPREDGREDPPAAVPGGERAPAGVA